MISGSAVSVHLMTLIKNLTLSFVLIFGKFERVVLKVWLIQTHWHRTIFTSWHKLAFLCPLAALLQCLLVPLLGTKVVQFLGSWRLSAVVHGRHAVSLANCHTDKTYLNTTFSNIRVYHVFLSHKEQTDKIQ